MNKIIKICSISIYRFSQYIFFFKILLNDILNFMKPDKNICVQNLNLIYA